LIEAKVVAVYILVLLNDFQEFFGDAILLGLVAVVADYGHLHVGNLKLLQAVAKLGCPQQLEGSFVLEWVSLQFYRLNLAVYVSQDLLQVFCSVLVNVTVLEA